jgi:hypothetical protein
MVAGCSDDDRSGSVDPVANSEAQHEATPSLQRPAATPPDVPADPQAEAARAPAPCLPPVYGLHSTLSLLFEAYRYAQELDRDTWDFAVEIQALRAAGATHSDLRWLVCNDLVEHAGEAIGTGRHRRLFHQTGSLTFTERTCFVLTDRGVRIARPGNGRAAVLDELPARTVTTRTLVPHWDKDRQELRLGGCMIKQFKVPAPNQELILEAFEEDGWPPRIDDPLPRHPSLNAKRRLHETITTLNRHHKHRLVRFLGDGSGEGVRWELLCSAANGNGS